ncbi:MAG: PAS domain-containing protein, partial [Lentisphaerota bacterium]
MQSYNYHSAKPKIRSRWLPILIGALCFVTLLMLSWKLRDREQENLQNTISSEAEHLATDIKVDFRNRVQFLESMVKRWELQKGTSKDEYINDTGSLLSIALGFQAVEWVDKDFYVRWISPLKGNEKAQNLNLAFEENRRSTMEKARDTQSPAVSKPIDLVQGGKGFLVFFPIYFDGKFDGFILAVFEIHKWLDYVFGFDSKNSLSDKYNICIYFDDVPVYKNGDFVKQTYTMQATEVIKVLDKNISIYIEPSKAFIKVDIASLPNLTIFIGIFLSVIIAFVVFLFQRTYIEVKRTHLSNNILESKTALLKAQTNSNIDGILVIDHNNKRLLINKRFVELFNAPTEVQEDEDDTAMLRHVTSLTQYPDQFLDKIKYLNSHPNEISRDEIEFKSGMVIDRYSSPVQGEDGQYYGRIWVFHDITERKNTETYKEMRLEVLNILNEQKDLKFSILRVIHTLKTQTGFDAVGIRLQNGEDFPYFGHEGFSDDFLATENTLIRHDANGWVCKDKDGKVCLECTCGIVISGKTDPTDPLFTHGGSFWTNNSFSLLDLPSYQDPRFHPRNKCIYQGYASWALIPIRSQERIIGLIHISSRNKKALSIERIEILEVIASHIGSFLMRIKSEEELIELSSRFSLAARAGGVGIWDYDIVNNKLAWDDRMFELYGIKREQFSGAYEAWQSGLHPDDKIRGDAEIQMAIKGEKEFNTEFRVIWPDRTIRYIRAMSSVSRDVKGKPIHMIGTNWDITESMKMEQTLKTQLMNISAILENSPYLMWLKDSEGKFLSVNENFAHSCGRNNPNELIGLTDLDIWPEDLARKYRSDDSKVIALKSRSIVEEPIEDLGHRKWFETIKTPIIDDTGSVIGTVGMARDVTERREYQENLNKEKERLKNVILGTNAGTWEWNLQTGKTLFNDRWAEIAGYTLEELEPVNIKTWEKLIHPDDLIKSGMLLQKHFNKESDYYSCDCRIRHKNGSWIWVSDKGRLMQWDESGKPLLMSGTHIDISERKKIESDLKIQNDFYTILTRLSEKLIQTDSSAIDDAINSALKTLGTFNNVDRSYIFEVDESADEMSNTYEWCEEGITSERMNLQKLPFSLIPRWKDEYSHNRYVYIESVKDLPTECQSEKDVLEPQGIKSLVTVPMYYGSSLLGFIGFDSVRSIKSWNLQVINLLKIIASVIAGVITKKNTEALLQKAKDRADK